MKLLLSSSLLLLLLTSTAHTASSLTQPHTHSQQQHTQQSHTQSASEYPSSSPSPALFSYPRSLFHGRSNAHSSLPSSSDHVAYNKHMPWTEEQQQADMFEHDM